MSTVNQHWYTYKSPHEILNLNFPMCTVVTLLILTPRDLEQMIVVYGTKNLRFDD